MKKDMDAFGQQFTAVFNAQKVMFPEMSYPAIEKVIEEMKPTSRVTIYKG